MYRRMYLIVAATVLVGACSNLVPLNHVVAAEAKWRKRSIQDYDFTLEVNSLAPFTECSSNRLVDVQVRGGRTAKFGTCHPDAELAQQFGSIPQIFATIRADRNERPPRYLVRFNSSLGYPEYIDANFSRTMTDYVFRYYIEDFRPLNGASPPDKARERTHER